MSRGIVVEPKEDITAFELAHMTIAANTCRDENHLKAYLAEKCPSAIRHFPAFEGK